VAAADEAAEADPGLFGWPLQGGAGGRGLPEVERVAALASAAGGWLGALVALADGVGVGVVVAVAVALGDGDADGVAELLGVGVAVGAGWVEGQLVGLELDDGVELATDDGDVPVVARAPCAGEDDEP
jgi:hypothetical protein